MDNTDRALVGAFMIGVAVWILSQVYVNHDIGVRVQRLETLTMEAE